MHGSNRLHWSVVAGLALAILTSATVALAGPGAPGSTEDDNNADKKEDQKEEKKDE